MGKDYAGIALAGLGGGLWLFYRGFRELRIKSIVSGLATSKVRSLAMGTVELSGTAEILAPLEDPIYHQPCVFYHIEVEEQRGSGKRSRWVTIYESDSFSRPFYLADETGRVAVLPQGARVYCDYDLDLNVNWVKNLFASTDPQVANFLDPLSGRMGGSLHLRAQIVREKEPVYVIGYAVPIKEPLTFVERAMRKVTLSIHEIARRLKSDPARMRALDRDKDGRIDPMEWDEGLKQLSQELEEKPRAAVQPAIPVLIRATPDGFMVLSDKREAELLSKLGLTAWIQILLGPALAVASAVYLARRFGLI